MKTGATLFTGFGGADIGMKMTGITPLWGIELDNGIASVARMNGMPAINADIMDVDPFSLPRVDFLHASPPCPNFSVAKTNAKETKGDIAIAQKVTDFVATLKPKVFTLENVWGYRNSESWRLICDALYTNGYWVAVDHVNFADYGVPQTRKRMIVRAIKGVFFGTPLPPKEAWRGWYEAVKDLIPTFEASNLAKWQSELIPEHISQSLLVDGTGNGNMTSITTRRHDKPSFTITASVWKRPIKALLIDCANSKSNGKRKYRLDDEPAKTITASDSSNTKAIIGAHVLRLTTRALARLQSFPDSYQLPKNNKLACRGIGNACPPVGMAKIFNSLSTVATTDKTNVNNKIFHDQSQKGDGCKEVALTTKPFEH